MFPLVQMGRTLTPRCCRLWATRRWRFVEKCVTKQSVNSVNVFISCFMSSFCSQYAVPVTKYDRKGYKARPRQLLLTSNSAVIVEEAKLKQRIDYGALKGQRSTATFFCFYWMRAALFTHETLSFSCRCLSQLTERRLVCSARAQWRQQTEGETKDLSQSSCSFVRVLIKFSLCVCLMVNSQGDVVLQSDHVIETLTKIAICADKMNNININQGRWGAETALS